MVRDDEDLNMAKEVAAETRARGETTTVVVSSGVPWQALGWVACGLALICIYQMVLRDLFAIWWNNQDYSYGMLVGPFAAYLAWRKRGDLSRLKLTPSWAGALLLLVAALIRVYGVVHYFDSLERYSLIVAVWGVVFMLSGWRRTRLMIGILLFLVLMIPLPGRVETAITLPMQRFAAQASAWVLNVMGWEAITHGNIIRMYGQDMEVAAACNGLRMVFAIVTLGCALVYLSDRPTWERLIVAGSSVVIGIGANVIRIVATGIVSQIFPGSVSAEGVHDVAGWLMMPLALMFLWWGQYFLRSLFVGESAYGGAGLA